MNKPLLGSLVAASLLLGDASAATMYERFEAMEKEMNRLQAEIADLKAEKAEKPAARTAEADDEEGDDEDDAEEADEAGAEEGDEEAPAASADDEDAEEADDEGDDEEEEDETAELLEELEESVHDLNRATSGNHLKLGVDFRTSYDYVNYEMVNGDNYESTSLFSNRLWVNMDWLATENISFTGQLAYNKTYGARWGTNPMDLNAFGAGFEDFDWTGNENPNGDGNLRVKSAYFFYRNDTFMGTNIPWTFSLGRRPSTNGHLINMRDDDPAASPSGHTINVEFDGMSSKFSLEKLTGATGMYVKFCAGQGATDAAPMFNSTPRAENKDDALKNIHLGGLIFVPYDDGQYSIGTQFYGASNLIDMVDVTQPNLGFETVGDLYSGSIYAMINGIGNEWADFLDYTTFFVSGAMSRTNPDDGSTMFGKDDMRNGYSYWVGLQMPSLFTEDGRFGLEFNHGSEYWRSITYGEDTMIGSKVAARGDAYEVYFTEPLIDDVFSMQIRYTYIDYDYTGSNGFFGSQTGTPMRIEDIPESAPMAGQVVDKAQDVRVYLRYRY